MLLFPMLYRLPLRAYLYARGDNGGAASAVSPEDPDAEDVVFAWQEALEAVATHYRVRIRTGEAEWFELDPADRRSSYDDRRLTRDGGW